MGKEKSKILNETLEEIMMKSPRKYEFKNQTKTYAQLVADYDNARFFKKEFKSIMKWINAIFGRWENIENTPGNLNYRRSNEYSSVEDNQQRIKAIDEINMIARMQTYIVDCFFSDENREYLEDYKAILNLFKKICTERDWDFDDRHNHIEKLYDYLWEKESEKRTKQAFEAFLSENSAEYTEQELKNIRENIKREKKQELNDYVLYYETLAVLSEDLPDLDIKDPHYRFVEIRNSYRELKAYFSKIVVAYIVAMNGVIECDEKLTDTEIGFMEFLYDLNDKQYEDYLPNATKGLWEAIDIETRERIISYVDELHKSGEQVISKYTGGGTTQQIRIKIEEIKFKLHQPISYRIFSIVKDIQAHLPFTGALEQKAIENDECNEAKDLSKIEKDLTKILNMMMEIDKEQDDFIKQLELVCPN